MPAELAARGEVGTLEALIPSWERSLRARNKSTRTVRAYSEAARLFETFVRSEPGVTGVGHITREHVESFIEDQLARWKPATASVRYRSVQQLFKWLLEEGEIRTDPMARMKPPVVPEVPVTVVSDAELKKLIEACEGSSFEDRRDVAIVRVFIDTGVRLAECAGMEVDDVDFGEEAILITAGGRRQRAVPFGTRTAQALDRYLRVRARHPKASVPALWLGPRGGMTGNGIGQMIARRCRRAGIGHIHPQQLRHTAAHVWMANGGGESDAMRLFGWRSPTMPSRYGASAPGERAREAHRRLRPGDRL
jgi:site-specific recombinase XerD